MSKKEKTLKGKIPSRRKFFKAAAATGAVTGTGGPFTPTDVAYASDTGVLTLTIPSHGRSNFRGC